jgi:uncharacterized protein (DUF2141 family)
MARKILIFFILIFFSISLNSKESGSSGKIIVKITNIKNDKGIIRSQLFDNPEDFPTHSDKAFKKTVGKIINNECTIMYENVPFGEYAITVHHDEDLNGFMNKNFLGYPKEGYGISNNPTIILSLPTFDESKFVLNKEVLIITIKMKK